MSEANGECRVERRKVDGLIIGLVLVGLVTACGSAPATPTPLPASIVRPEQPAPVYPTGTAFTLVTPTGIAPLVVQLFPAFAAAEATQLPPLPLDLSLLQPPPTALGIVRAGAALFEQPNGKVLQQLPAGATLTLTGKAADDIWLAAYTDQGESGWVAANTLALFGAETLTVVTQASGPGPAATLVAQAMAPMAMPTIVLTLTPETGE